MSWIAVGAGAALGAWMRWILALWLNAPNQTLAWGTLAANLGGGYLAGLALGFFMLHPGIGAEWRLFAITGLLGGLTTFSTFSLEAMLLVQRGQYAWMLGHAALHVAGSILLCIAGFATWRWLNG